MTHIFAHRGASGEAPENTLTAFERAVEAGADGVECDVHLSRDGVPVVIHDDTVDRTTDGRGPVQHHTLAALRALDAGAWFGDGRFRGARVPTLAEVLHLLVPTGLALNVELKTEGHLYPGLVDTVAELLRRSGMAARSVVSSFSLDTLRELRVVAPELAGAAVLHRRADTAAALARAGAEGLRALHVPGATCSPELVAACRAAGLAVCAWTVNAPAEATRLFALGVDAVVTDQPARLLALRAEHRGSGAAPREAPR